MEQSREEAQAGIQLKRGTQYFYPVSSNIMRCVFTRDRRPEPPSVLVDRQPNQYLPMHREESEETLCITSGSITIRINKETEVMDWYRTGTSYRYMQETGRCLAPADLIRYTTEGEEPVIHRVKTVDGERNFVQNLKPEIAGSTFRAKLFFQWEEEEGIYGLGQAEEGIYNYRGHHQYLYQHNMRIPMPVFISSRKYAVFFDCGSLMTFHDDQDGSYLYLDAVQQLDYYVIVGETMDELIDGLRRVTGKAALLPRWAYGYIQSKEQYYSAKELVDTASRYRELGIPIDCVVQDWNSWTAGNWGEKITDPERYGDLKEQLAELHKMHVHAMVSVWPNMNTGGKNHTEFLENSYLLYDYATYNAFEKPARDIYWRQAKEGLFDKGFDAWWCDSTEPFSGPDWNGEVKREEWERFQIVGGEHKKYLGAERANLFALAHAQGIYENQRKETEEARVMNLTRSGYLSGQQYGAMLWSGDIVASWDTMRRQLTEGLNMSMSGYPYWTLDIGGFFTVGERWQNRGCGCNQDMVPKWFWNGEYDEGVKDPAYCELYTRWLQMGVFLPMFRSHGTDTPREIWNFGKEGEVFYDTIAAFIRLRYRLMPYIYTLAGEVYWKNKTILRSLLFDFAEDPEALRISDQFLFGTSIMVCPVFEAMYYEAGGKILDKPKKRRCYLPSVKGGWYDYWTADHYNGGKWIEADAPIERVPVFIKAGSLIPEIQGIKYADADNGNPVEIHIYPGKDGSFSMYEDEGNSYRYEDGRCAWIRFHWSDSEKLLTIEERRGAFKGMKEVRSFLIVYMDKSITVEYSGREITVKI